MTLRLLLDTHALLWWFSGDRGLSTRARRAMARPDNEIVVSAASAWEIATKQRLGKLPGIELLIDDLPAWLENEGFTTLPIRLDHALRAGALPGPMRDPFDRMLIAQAAIEDLPLVSNETSFEHYGIKRLW